jgi:twinkle protein
VPGLYQISGSANWANKPDYGLSYSRPDKTTNIAKVTVTKVKMGWPGKEGDIELAYDWRTSTYEIAP